MLTIRDLHFAMAGNPLFEGASAQIPAGAKVGIVGRNGTGKTTLFRLIRGELGPDQGEITLPPRARIGGVAQEAPGDHRTLIETVLAFDEERAGLMAEAETATDPHRIAEIQTRLIDIDAHSAEARAATILSGLGFDHDAQNRASKEFSGGWRMRVALAGVLFSAPDVLLLDEPTNYLDLEGAMWLESYLARYPHTVIIISHDRGLLNRAVNNILHLSEKKLTLYGGGYDRFDAERRQRLAHQQAAAQKQEAARAHMQAFVDRFRYKASKARQAQSRLKMLEKMEPIAATMEGAVTPFRFPSPEELAPPLLRLDGVRAGYGEHTVLRRLDLRIDQDDRIALLGANGQGKSTLAKIIAGDLAPMAGQRIASSKLRIGFFAQHQGEVLNLDETPLDHIRRRFPQETPSKLRARLANAGLRAETVETKVGKISGGQKARLMMCLATLDAPHLFILDEPTNHLDIESREALVSALNDYTGAVILITHDSHLVNLVADRLWLVKDGAVTPFEEDMDAYRRLLLSERNGPIRQLKEPKQDATEPRRKQAPKGDLARLRAEARKCEERVEKLQDMLERIDTRLAAADFYERPAEDIATFQTKRAEIVEGLERAEALWLAAAERLESAGG